MDNKNLESLGCILDKKIYISSKNKNPNNIYYCDARLGCHICEKGNPCSFKIKIPENDIFLMNDISISISNDNYIKLDLYYLCFDKESISMINNYSKLIDGSTNCNKYYSSNKRFKCCTSSGIETIFKTESLDNIKEIHICSNCMQWLKVTNKRLDFTKFYKINPLILFWKQFIDDIIHENVTLWRGEKNKLFFDIDYINENDKEYLINEYQNYFTNIIKRSLLI